MRFWHLSFVLAVILKRVVRVMRILEEFIFSRGFVINLSFPIVVYTFVAHVTILNNRLC